jgi:hypothetical protein
VKKQKAMRKLDFILQTAGLTGAMIALVSGKQAYFFILIIQFVLGCEQLISAVIRGFVNSPIPVKAKRKLRMYWYAVIIYFVGLALISMLNQELLLQVWFLSAWAIAIYYYTITKQVMDYKKTNRSFLDLELL